MNNEEKDLKNVEVANETEKILDLEEIINRKQRERKHRKKNGKKGESYRIV